MYCRALKYFRVGYSISAYNIKESLFLQERRMFQNLRHMISSQPQTQVENIPQLMNAEAVASNKELASVYSQLTRELEQEGENCPIYGEAMKHLVKVLNYVTPYGKEYEGIGIVKTYRMMETPEKQTPEIIKLAHILSWCMAFHVVTTMVMDDVMDGSRIRRGVACWNTLPNVGLTAVNDAYLVENAVYQILKKYFSGHRYYTLILELYLETNYKWAKCQAIDVLCMADGKPRFEIFNKERYQFMATCKASTYCYEVPIKLAMCLRNKYVSELDTQILSIAKKVALLISAHNDVQDSFGKPGVVGKECVDIRNGKCTWLAVETLQRGTSAQKQLFMEHYGKPSFESERIVQNLYKELKLNEAYRKLENETFDQIYKEAIQISEHVPIQVFETFLQDVTLHRDGCY